jgi:hypothetical protein
MEEKDLSEFDKNVMNLFDVCKNIMNSQEKRSISSSRKNPILSRLEKYEKTYSKTDPEEHVNYFEKIYTDNKRFILLGPQRNSWLLDGNIIISFGQECNLKTEIKLYLSGIYSTAIKLRQEIKEESKGLPNISMGPEMDYPDDFMFFLYQIFKEVATVESEKSKLDTHIESLSGQIKTGNNDALAGLFDMASGMAEKVSGKKIPKDKMPGKNDIGKMFSSVMDNPQTKTMLGNMMQEFQNSNNMGEMFTKMVGSLGAMAGEQSSNDQVENNNDQTENSNEKVIEEGDVNDEFSE